MEGFTMIILLYLVILPGAFIFILWNGVFKSQREWGGLIILSALYFLFIFFTGAWDALSYYIRYVWIVLFLLATYKSIKKMKSLPFRKPPSLQGKWGTGFLIIIGVVFAVRIIGIFSSFSVAGDQIHLSYPLKDGTFYTGHGGSSTVMNYHHAYEPQQYALDISQLNPFGMRAHGVYPQELEKYEIFGTRLYSPCDGMILETESDRPDLIPPETDSNHPYGNYIALTCDGSDVTVYLAHLQQNSIEMNEQSSIQAGEFLGRVGNSGNTTEPHLHIHAEEDGVGVKMIFNGKYPVRNSLVKN